jgi:hypothetical protein
MGEIEIRLRKGNHMRPRVQHLLPGLAAFMLLAVPVGLTAASAPGAAAAVASPRASAAVTTPAVITGPSNFDCGHQALISKSGTNGGLPVYLVSSGAGCLDGIHKCQVVGPAEGGNEAVECVDIYVEGNPENPSVFPVVSGYCQGSQSPFTLVQCANVDMPFDLNSPAGNYGVSSAVCGHSAGPCDNPANTFGHNSYLGHNFNTPSGCAGAGSVHELWTVALSGGTIELPGDYTITIPANFASPHAIVCG